MGHVTVWGCMLGPRTVKCDVGFCLVLLKWCSIGVVDGDGKVSIVAVVQLATSMHGEMRCRYFSSSLFGLSTAKQPS